jgi:gliding motility-associated-like protein
LHIPFCVRCCWREALLLLKKNHEPRPVSRVRFIENKGQWDNQAVFASPLPGGHLWVEKNAFHFIFHNQQDVASAFRHPRPFEANFQNYPVHFHAVRVNFAGANTLKATGELPRTEYYNYFKGSDPEFWRSGVRVYEQILLQQLYPGIDALLYTSPADGMKYDFMVKPDAAVSDIRMHYQGQQSIKLKSGSLHITTSVNKWVEQRPYAYQWINGRKQEVDCAFRLEKDTVSFIIGAYDKTLPLVIDPVLIFSTYSGSSVDNFGHTATYDKDGNLYAAGIATSPDGSIPNGRYPVTPGAYQQVWGGGVGAWPQPSFPCDISISKYTPDGTALVYATYLGGDRNDYPHSIVTDKYNNLVVFGTTQSLNFPTTTSAYDRTHNDSFDIIVSKLSADGTQLLGSTFVGGSGADGINVADSLRMNYSDEFRGEVIIDNANDIIVASSTSSANFPITTGVYQTLKNSRQDGCIFKLDSMLTSLKASTFVGQGNNDAIYSLDVDNGGNIYFAGGTQSQTFPVSPTAHLATFKGGFSDAFIGRLNASLTSLMSFRYWGSNAYDQAHFVRIDPLGNPVIFGQNYDSIPIINAVFRNRASSLFITKFKPALDSILFSTTIGDSIPKNALPPSAFMIDECGVIYGSVWGGSTNAFGHYAATHPGFISTTQSLPLTADAFQATTDHSDFYLFAISRNADSLVYGTYFGENNSADHVDGGTSRFDKKGIIYQSVCASCFRGSAGTFTTTPNAYATTNLSPSCSNASFKLDFRKSNVVTAAFDFAPKKFCLDSYVVVNFTNDSYNGKHHRWYINGVLKDTSFHMSDTISSPGTYVIKLVEIDSARCIILDSITKTFATGMQANASFTVFRDTCSPNVTFTNTTTPANAQIKWYFGNGDTSSAQTLTRTFGANGLYQILLIANPGTLCEDSAVYDLFYDSTSHIVKASFAPRDSFNCEPANILLLNTSNKNNNLKWYINDTLVSTDFLLDTALFKGNYAVKLVVEDSPTCNKKDSFMLPIKVLPEAFPDFSYVQDGCSLGAQFTNLTALLPGDTVKYLWQFGNGKTSTEKDPFAIFDTAGTYPVTLTINNGLWCQHAITKNVTIAILPGVLNAFFSAMPDRSCTPGIITFTNLSSNDQTREWYFNNTLRTTGGSFTDTFYTDTTIDVKLIVFNPNTCITSDTLIKTISVENATTSAFTAIRDTCSNLVIFNNQSTSNNNEPLSYIWYFGDGDSSVVTNPTHVYAKDSIYTIQLITNRGSFCADTSEVIINYNDSSQFLEAAFSLNDSIFCTPAIIHATDLSVNGNEIKWYLNNVLVSTDSIFTDTIDTQGTYTLMLIAENNLGCQKADTMTRNIIVSLSANADFGIARDSCSLEVHFKNLSSSTGGLSYKWYFGDGDSSAETHPVHAYKQTDLYTVILMVNAGSPCADTIEKIFLFDGDTTREIFIPNVFTPNGDGLNDCYSIRGVSPKCDEYKVTIYNRWGEIYFKSTDPSQCWNGKNEAGASASVGVYYYIMSIKKRDQEKMEKHGTITLIRD